MMYKRLIALVILAFMAAGCAGNKKLSRDKGPFETVWPNEALGLSGNRVVPGPFDGKLNLFYEKKIKGSVDSPIIIGEKYLGFTTTRRRFVILERESGEKAFRFKSKKDLLTEPIISDSLLILVKQSEPSRIQVINLFTGKTIRERQVKEIRSGPIMVLNSLIFGAGSGLMALNLSDLETVWVHEAKEMVGKKPVSEGSIIYYVSGNKNVRAVRADNGETLWEHTVQSAIASDLTLGSFLYFGDVDGRVMALDARDGETVWEARFDYPSRGGVAEFDDRVYFGGGDGLVYCLSAVDGSELWQYRTEGVVTAPPVVFGDAVLIGSQDRYLYSLNRRTGELLDRRRLEGAITGAAAVDNGQMYIGCRNNRIYRLEVQ